MASHGTIQSPSPDCRPLWYKSPVLRRPRVSAISIESLGERVVAQVPGTEGHDLRRLHVRREPVAVGSGDEVVVAAILEVDRHDDVADIEAPRLRERQHVVYPTIDAGSKSIKQLCGDLGLALLHLHQIRVRHLVRVAQEVPSAGLEPINHDPGLPLGNDAHRRFTLERGTELDHVSLGHSGKPVEVRRVMGRDRDRGLAANDPVGQQGGDGEGVRTAAGATSDREPIRAQRIGDRENVRQDACDTAARQPRRFTVARAIERQAPDPMAGVDGRVVPPADATAGVPWNAIRGRPFGSPHSATAIVRPSAVRTRCSRCSGIALSSRAITVVESVIAPPGRRTP